MNQTGETEARKLPDPPLLKRENTIGACFMYTRRVCEEIGNFDNRLALAEDYDYLDQGVEALPDAAPCP